MRAFAFILVLFTCASCAKDTRDAIYGLAVCITQPKECN